MSVIEDLDEINKLLSKAKMTVKEEREEEGISVVIADDIEIEEITEEMENVSIDVGGLRDEEINELRKEFDEIFKLLEEGLSEDIEDEIFDEEE